MAVLCISLSRYANRAYHPRCTFLSCCSLSSDGLLLLFTLQPAGGSRLLQKRRSGGLSWWRMNGNEVEAGAGRSFCSVCCTRVCPNLCTRISVVDIYSSVNADVEHLSSRALNVRNITIFFVLFFQNTSQFIGFPWRPPYTFQLVLCHNGTPLVDKVIPTQLYRILMTCNITMLSKSI